MSFPLSVAKPPAPSPPPPHPPPPHTHTHTHTHTSPSSTQCEGRQYFHLELFPLKVYPISLIHMQTAAT